MNGSSAVSWIEVCIGEGANQIKNVSLQIVDTAPSGYTLGEQEATVDKVKYLSVKFTATGVYKVMVTGKNQNSQVVLQEIVTFVVV